MCDPTIMTVVQVAGAVAGAVGQYQQSSAQKATAKYQAAVARNNQIIAQRQAADRLKQGEQEERTFRRRLEQLKGKQRSVFSGSGVIVDEGSPLDTLAETAEFGEIDAFTIRRNAEREAYGIERQADGFGQQATLATSQAKNINPFFDAGSTLLTSASRFNFDFGTTKPTASGA